MHLDAPFAPEHLPSGELLFFHQHSMIAPNDAFLGFELLLPSPRRVVCDFVDDPARGRWDLVTDHLCCCFVSLTFSAALRRGAPCMRVAVTGLRAEDPPVPVYLAPFRDRTLLDARQFLQEP